MDAAPGLSMPLPTSRRDAMQRRRRTSRSGGRAAVAESGLPDSDVVTLAGVAFRRETGRAEPLVSVTSMGPEEPVDSTPDPAPSGPWNPRADAIEEWPDRRNRGRHRARAEPRDAGGHRSLLARVVGRRRDGGRADDARRQEAPSEWSPTLLNGHAPNGHEVNGHGSNGHGSNGHGSNGHGSNGHGSNGLNVHDLNGHGRDGYGVDHLSVNGNGANGHPPDYPRNGEAEVPEGFDTVGDQGFRPVKLPPWAAQQGGALTGSGNSA
jgi:hypothetical protein